ncbi:MAG: glutathione S-transferase family protein [Alphaproteobacteria bacterium]|jgi:glutathione S-transferase|nr:glutathione S-transferase family protein [Alphaproteobacteria bacterium]
MKLHYWRASPHACKVLAVVHHLGLKDVLEQSPLHPWEKETPLTTLNPLGKVPVLECEEPFSPLFDSGVICEYLASMAKDPKNLYPKEMAQRISALRFQALGDGMMEAAVLHVVEQHARPSVLQSSDWLQRQRSKLENALHFLEDHVTELQVDRPTIGDIAVAMALSYINFRLPSYVWHPVYPALTAWFEKMLRLPEISESLPKEIHTLPQKMDRLEN